MLLLVLLLALLTGCAATPYPMLPSDPPSGRPPPGEPLPTLALEQGAPLGQTFTTYDAGLDGFSVWLRPDPAAPATGELVLTLHARPPAPALANAATAPAADMPLATVRLPADQIAAPGWYHFPFAPRQGWQPTDYMLRLTLTGAGGVLVGHADGAAYLDGAAYQHGTPLADAQLLVRPTFQPAVLLFGMGARALLAWLPLLAFCGLLFVLPGWVVLGALWPAALPWPARAGLAIGVSVALYPLLLLWAHTVGLQPGAWAVWLVLLPSVGALLWQQRALRPWSALRGWRGSAAFWPDCALLLVLALVFGVRLWAAVPLSVPLWGDSYHHTLIAQLLLDRGGLFQQWQPYAELESLSYHFGFHSAVAAFCWLTGRSLPGAMVDMGQVFNGLAVLALYPLAWRAGGTRWAGVGAVLVAGLLTAMPMSYTNWGRYTQLAGQTMLPAAVLLLWGALTMQPWRRGALTLAGVVLAGLFLTHYRVVLFAACFVPALLLFEGRAVPWRGWAGRLALLGVVAGLLVAPWALNLFGSRLLALAASIAAVAGEPDAQATRVAAIAINNNIGELTRYLPLLVWLLLPLALTWAAWRRARGVLLVALWWFCCLLLVNPHWFGLPGAGTITNFALLIAAYIPASVLLGCAGAWLLLPLLARWQGALLAGALLLVLAGWGVSQRADDVQPEPHALATRADLRAAAWIASETPADAHFLVHTFFAHEAVVVGTDGGWWLPLLAHRTTMLPPASYDSEQGPQPAYQSWVNQLPATIQAEGLDDPATLALLQARGITHVYIGQQHGRVTYTGAPTLTPTELLASPHFHLRYHQDRVWIFAFVP